MHKSSLKVNVKLLQQEFSFLNYDAALCFLNFIYGQFQRHISITLC